MCVCTQTFKLVCGFGGNSAREKRGRVSGLEGVTQLCSEKVLLFITSTHMSTYLLRLPDSTLFPGIVMSVSDPILLSLYSQSLDI